MTLVLVLCTLALAHAHPADTDVETIHKLDEIHSKLKQGVGDCTDCEATRTAADEPAWRQCYRQLCPGGYGGLHREIKKSAQSMISAPDEDFEAALTEAMHELIAARLHSVREIRRAIANDRHIDDLAARRLLRFKRLNRPDVPQGRETIPTVKAMVRAMARFEDKGPLDEPFATLSQRKSTEEIGALMKEGRAELEQLDRSLRAKTGFRDLENEEILAGTDVVTAERYEALRANLRGTRLTEFIIGSPKFDKAGRMSIREMFGPLDPDLARQEALLLRYSGDRMEIQRDPIGKVLFAELKNCSAAFYNNRHFAPTPEQLSAFNQSLPKIKDRFVASLKPQMSADSTARLEARTKSWKFDIPAAAATQKSNFIARLKTLAKSNQAMVAEVNEAKAHADYRLVALHLDDVSSTKAIQHELGRACSAFQTAPIRDSYTFGKQKLQVGPYTVAHPKFAEPVLRHEFGHATSDLFASGEMSEASTTWFDRTRECLGKIPGHQDRVEEDWSDLVSRLAEGENESCDLLSDSEKAFTVKGTPGDPHSSTLYRVLHHNYARHKPIPSICTEELRARGERFAPDCSTSVKRTVEATDGR